MTQRPTQPDWSVERPPIPALPLEYSGDSADLLRPVIRALAILVLIAGIFQAFADGLQLLLIFTRRLSVPIAQWQFMPWELAIFAVGLFQIISASIAIPPEGRLRPLLIWAWCKVGIVVGDIALTIYSYSNLIRSGGMTFSFSTMDFGYTLNREIYNITAPIAVIILLRHRQRLMVSRLAG